MVSLCEAPAGCCYTRDGLQHDGCHLHMLQACSLLDSIPLVIHSLEACQFLITQHYDFVPLVIQSLEGCQLLTTQHFDLIPVVIQSLEGCQLLITQHFDLVPVVIQSLQACLLLTTQHFDLGTKCSLCATVRGSMEFFHKGQQAAISNA